MSETELKNERFKEAAIEHMDSLYRFAIHISGDEVDAEDLLQDTYLKAYKFSDKFQEGTNLKAWMLTIMKNTFINMVRRNKNNKRMIALSDMEDWGYEPSVPPESEDNIFGYMFDDDVSAAVEELPEVYKTVVLLADVEGLPYKDIADMVGCPIGTVMSRLHRGRKFLREKLQEYAEKHGYSIPEMSLSEFANK
jgi:RNA polymerase sigma-70 factor (ECF subfamily)